MRNDIFLAQSLNNIETALPGKTSQKRYKEEQKKLFLSLIIIILTDIGGTHEKTNVDFNDNPKNF
jgi:hypothetical protein